MNRIVIWVFAFLLVALPAWAGSYLDRATLLVTEAQKAGEYLRRRPGDRELARLVHAVAAARLEAASRMLVPKEVTLAHPHLLLVLENHERAAAAAEEGNHPVCLSLELKADEEERILRSILEQLGWPLPKR